MIDSIKSNHVELRFIHVFQSPQRSQLQHWCVVFSWLGWLSITCSQRASSRKNNENGPHREARRDRPAVPEHRLICYLGLSSAEGGWYHDTGNAVNRLDVRRVSVARSENNKVSGFSAKRMRLLPATPSRAVYRRQPACHPQASLIPRAKQLMGHHIKPA